MTREQFQRIALVTIVVLLATVASQRLMAYGFNHDERYVRFVDAEVDERCEFDTAFDVAFDLDTEFDVDVHHLRLETDRMRAEAHRLSDEARHVREMVRIEVR